MILTVLTIITILITGYFIYVRLNPAFGGDVTKTLQNEYASKSPNYTDGKFININGVDDDISFGKAFEILKKMLFKNYPKVKPEKALPIIKADSTEIAQNKTDTQLIWFGHSAFLLQIDGKNVLIDPMLTDMPSPIPSNGQKRFNTALPIEIEQLPHIDLVLISHDHYDHLDHKSIQRLKHKVGHYLVPLGVGVHLEAWGISKNKITELDWWQETNFKGLKLACTPAQHFSGRKLNNRAGTLWCSWVIKSNQNSIFFSGDSGYNTHFKTIGNTYGPFDFAMMECGQYNKLWPLIHMMPEETVQAGIDVKAKVIMPIHWGAFKLAMHDWNDPVKRVFNKANELNIPIITPKIGKIININDLEGTVNMWWE
ncbi:MBL fold metallo-hydrolase [Tamlana sp. 2201CG12-4]|uniref:MBL fold metallo-hydrolase n=1 Tax=Tamlana sp. 2201CG12-4 TaxID=3112582 RepID=UPI002DBF9947|nr:MBL fold metallo-hydrolase [Tamlana sp. 2201CG12-4]MEC3908131.1 MBL fold metallo-hydrolase [Tamlana sp. 2201CG12-4]